MNPLDFTVAQAVTPHDTNPNVFSGFIVSVAGNVVLTDTQGNTVTWPALAGVVYRISTRLIKATSTTATGIIGLS